MLPGLHTDTEIIYKIQWKFVKEIAVYEESGNCFFNQSFVILIDLQQSIGDLINNCKIGFLNLFLTFLYLKRDVKI